MIRHVRLTRETGDAERETGAGDAVAFGACWPGVSYVRDNK